MRRTQLFSILAILSLVLCAQVALAQTTYQRGYDMGYRMGQQDFQAGRASDYTRSTTYREAIEGWTGQGDREQYRSDFRFGFREGYQDGYRQARAGRVGTPATTYPSTSTVTTNQSELPADLRPHMHAAFHNGYYSGYAHGQRDTGRQYNAKHDVEYQRALHGYDANQHGNDQEAYKRDYRAGYLVGYDDAYNRRNQDVNAAWQRASTEGISYLPSVGGSASQPVPPYGVGQGRGPNRNVNPQDQAYVNGYRLGYDEGRQEQGQQYRPQDSRVWREGISGYNARRHSSAQEYRATFRQGFEAGYDDGYNGRTAQAGVNAPRGFGQRVYGQTGVSGDSIFVPAGTTVRLRLNNTISTRTNREGDRFTATVTEPVYAQGGEVAIPSGSTVSGVITSVERAGRVGGNSELQLRYESITLPGGNQYQVQASTEGVAQSGNVRIDPEEGQVEGKSSTTRDVGTVAAGAVLGAIIGGIAGGGKGAGIGAAVGSAAGLGAILTTRGRDVDIPSGTAMDIRLQNGLELRRFGTAGSFR